MWRFTAASASGEQQHQNKQRRELDRRNIDEGEPTQTGERGGAGGNASGCALQLRGVWRQALAPTTTITKTTISHNKLQTATACMHSLGEMAEDWLLLLPNVVYIKELRETIMVLNSDIRAQQQLATNTMNKFGVHGRMADSTRILPDGCTCPAPCPNEALDWYPAGWVPLHMPINLPR